MVKSAYFDVITICGGVLIFRLLSDLLLGCEVLKVQLWAHW